MLSATERGVPAEARTRLVVEPARQVSVSVLPFEDPARAEDVSLEAGIPERILGEHDAVVRQTHRRAGVVVLDVSEDRAVGLLRALGGPGEPREPGAREVDALFAAGILVCAPAGNAGPAAGSIGSPRCGAGAITVGALAEHGRHADYSSRGPGIGLRAHKPDVV